MRNFVAKRLFKDPAPLDVGLNCPEPKADDSSLVSGDNRVASKKKATPLEIYLKQILNVQLEDLALLSLTADENNLFKKRTIVPVFDNEVEKCCRELKKLVFIGEFIFKRCLGEVKKANSQNPAILGDCAFYIKFIDDDCVFIEQGVFDKDTYKQHLNSKIKVLKDNLKTELYPFLKQQLTPKEAKPEQPGSEASAERRDVHEVKAEPIEQLRFRFEALKSRYSILMEYFVSIKLELDSGKLDYPQEKIELLEQLGVGLSTMQEQISNAIKIADNWGDSKNNKKFHEFIKNIKNYEFDKAKDCFAGLSSLNQVYVDVLRVEMQIPSICGVQFTDRVLSALKAADLAAAKKVLVEAQQYAREVQLAQLSKLAQKLAEKCPKLTQLCIPLEQDKDSKQVDEDISKRHQWLVAAETQKLAQLQQLNGLAEDFLRLKAHCPEEAKHCEPAIIDAFMLLDSEQVDKLLKKLRQSYEQKLQEAEDKASDLVAEAMQLRLAHEEIKEIKKRCEKLETLIATCKKEKLAEAVGKGGELVQVISALDSKYQPLQEIEDDIYDERVKELLDRSGQPIAQFKAKLAQNSEWVARQQQAVDEILQPIKGKADEFFDKINNEIIKRDDEAKRELKRRKHAIQTKKELLQARCQRFNGIVEKARQLIPEDKGFSPFSEVKHDDIEIPESSKISNNRHQSGFARISVPFSQQLDQRIQKSHAQLEALSKNLAQAEGASPKLTEEETKLDQQLGAFVAHMRQFRENVQNHALLCSQFVRSNLETINSAITSLIQSTESQLAACNPWFNKLDVDIKTQAEAKSEMFSRGISSLLDGWIKSEESKENKGGKKSVPPEWIKRAEAVSQSASQGFFWEFSAKIQQRANHAERYFWLLCAQKILTQLRIESQESGNQPNWPHLENAVLLLHPALSKIIQTDQQLRTVYGIAEDSEPQKPSLWQSLLSVFRDPFYNIRRAIQAIGDNHQSIAALKGVNEGLPQLAQQLSLPQPIMKEGQPISGTSYHEIFNELNKLESSLEAEQECRQFRPG